MEKKLDRIIKENIKKFTLKEDLVPTDKKNEINLVQNQSVNAFRMIFKLMDNTKKYMSYMWQNKQGKISNKDIDEVIDYIYNSLNSINNATINKMKR